MHKQIRHPAPIEIIADGSLKKSNLEISQCCYSLGAFPGGEWALKPPFIQHKPYT